MKLSQSFLRTAFVALLVGLSFGCSQSTEKSAPNTKTAQTEGGVVVWPNLTEIDGLSHELLAYMQAGDLDSIIKKAPVVNKQMNAVANDPIPANAKSKTELKALQKDLISLTREFDALLDNQLSKEEQAKIIIAFAPVTHEMMRIAGMPHQHSEPAAKYSESHDHEHKEGDGHSHSS